MAATVLVGVLLLSLGVYLFTIFGGFGADMSEKMNEKNVSEFNAQFTKYQSYQDETTREWKNTCRAQDVVTLANIARENNSQYDYTLSNQEDYYYVKIKVIIKRCS